MILRFSGYNSNQCDFSTYHIGGGIMYVLTLIFVDLSEKLLLALIKVQLLLFNIIIIIISLT